MDGKKNARRTAGNPFRRVRRWLTDYISLYIPKRGEDEKEEGRRTVKALAVYLLRGGAVFALSMLFGGAETVMGSFPLGIGLFFACSKTAPFSFAGIALDALLRREYGTAMFLVYSVTFVLRIVFGLFSSSGRNGQALFKESKTVRVFMAAGCGALIGIVKLIAGGFLYYDVFGALFGLAAAPLACFLFGCAIEREKRFTMLSEVGIAAVMTAAVYSLRGVTLAGFSMAAATAFMLAVWTSKEGGILRGGVYGMLCGLAFSPAYAPIFGLAGIASGLFWRISPYLSISAAAVTAMSFGMYLDGFASLRTFAPDILVSALAFALICGLKLDSLPRFFPRAAESGETAANSAAAAEKQRKCTALRLEGISDALCSLSDVFWNISDKLRRPSSYELRQSVTEAFENRCLTCAMCELCQQRDYTETIGVYDRLARAAGKKGVVERSDLPEYMLTRCRDIDRILAQINLSCAELLEKAHKLDKTEIFAADYEAMAKLVEEAGELGGDWEVNEELSEKARASLSGINFAATSVTVYGKRRLTVIAGGVDLSRVHMTSGELRTAFENICETPLNDPQFAIDGDFVTMTMESRRVFTAFTATASDKKEDEPVNGDCVSSFENKSDVYYALISDGMGSGREAAITSRICGVFCEKLLSAGNSKAITLEMLNNFIRGKSAECFATVDLLELDLLSGRAGFVKSGAAPSYIMRGGSLFRIASNTMPVGITRCINAEEIKFELMSGDVVVMVSDGVTGSLDEGEWLTEQLTYEWTDDLDEMANRILSSAKSNNPRSDDMTVALTRIMERGQSA